MLIQSRCVTCLIARAFEEVQLATPKHDVQLKAMTEVVGILHHSLTQGGRMEKIPAYVGTLRDQAIQRITGCSDPYLEIKRLSNKTALRLLPRLEAFVDEAGNQATRFRRACLVASLGNVIEYGVAGHEVPWDSLESLVAETEAELAIDHISKVFEIAQTANSILFLTDNAGEIIFDRILVKILSSMGSKVTVAVKGAPVLNDAMLEDAAAARVEEFAEVITTGGGSVGVLPQWCSDEFLTQFTTSELVIAKGMGHHETLPEFTLPAPTAHLLRTKCDPVACSLGVPKDRNIVTLLVNHKGPLGPLVKMR